MREKRISVMVDVKLNKLQGNTRVDTVYFEKKTPLREEQNVEYFLKPDMIIAENGLGTPKYNL